MPPPASRLLLALALGAALLVAFGLLRAVGPAYGSGIDGPSPQAAAGGTTMHCGDANGDGIVNSIDAVLVLQYSAHLIQAPVAPQRLDPDGNGLVDTRDVLLILQAAAHRFHVRDFRCPA